VLALNLEIEFVRIIDALETAKVPYALCGGLAVAVYGFVRHTNDIDILLHEEDLERAKAAVIPVGFSVESGLLRFNAGRAGEERVYRLLKVEGEEHVVLDFVLVTPALREVWEQRVRVDFGDRHATVVSKSGLIRMKELAGRPVDQIDLIQLKSEATNE
jgi:hypothetical protein